MSENGNHDNNRASFLIADCGAVNTTVALFDIVAGSHRLIARASAPTTVTGPHANITLGVQQAISHIAELTGRSLLAENGEIIMPATESGAGIDYFGATISAAPALRAVIAGLLEEVSVASARHALHTIYADEIQTFSLSDNLTEQERINTLLKSRPDLILLTGGIDGGDRRRLRSLAQTIEVGASLLNEQQPAQVIFAGNRAMREEVKQILERRTKFQVADNVRPSLETEHLAPTTEILGNLYQTLKLDDLPGSDDLYEWSHYPPVPTARAFAGMVDYFAALYEGNVLGVDLGGNSLTLAVAGEQQRLLIRSDLGMGSSLPHLLTQVEPGEIIEWSPVNISSSRLYSFIQDKALHPYTVPMTEEELYLEQTLARHLLRVALGDALESWQWSTLPSLNFLVIRGSTLVNAPRPGQSLLMILDALLPAGVFAVAIDKYGVLPALGWLARQEPLAAVQTMEGGALVDLGWVVAPAGRADPGQQAIHVIVDSDRHGVLEIDVASGELEVLPLAPGEEAALTLEPARPFDIGYGPGQGKKLLVSGGAVGLVIDARGRPIQLPEDDSARRSVLRQWQWDMGG